MAVIRSIKKILIANRGEIAIRIIKTCRKLGIISLCIYSEIDQDAQFVKLADEAVSLGPFSESSKTYLNVDTIIDIALKMNVDAVHPGYGFLSENSFFANKVKLAGIIFIGPEPESIEAIGNKMKAKILLSSSSADIPLIPGYNGQDQNPITLIEEAKKIAFPVLIKAAAGGGGKGMRVVYQAEDLEAAIDSAKTEAKNSFGDDKLLIEKYFENVRHIEFQIFGDQQGNMIHLYERECSIQRRHQKIIEESPSVIMTEQLREKMGSTAVKIGKLIRYCGAGTVEFIFDDATGKFYFLEVNTRLQGMFSITIM